MDNKEKWIEDILNSTKGMTAVPSDPYLASRIEAKLQQPVISRLPVQWVYVSAAAMVLLFLMNISIMRRTVAAPEGQSSGVSELMKEYGWSNDNLYSINLTNRSHE